MSYESMSIKKVIEDIDHNKVYLPALQRKFVWGKHQIELLFDSLMRNYPIGTFLFWRLQRKNAENYVFYEFLKEYDQRTPFNRRKTGAFSHEEITGILDGQQRLSSMYIGLMGTHTEKAPYKRTTNEAAYEKMCLYINLLSLPYTINEQNRIEVIEAKNFEFRFLAETSVMSYVTRKVGTADAGEEPMFWLKIGTVLSWDDDLECDQMIENFIGACKATAQKEALQKHKRLIKKFLETLQLRICKEKLLNYFVVAKDDLEDILKIFVRVNSGGTILNKSDLLFSTIVATWDNGREQIETLQKSINNKGDKFNFSNEYLMRCCLVLTDAPVVYKVNSFKAENVQKIRDEWSKISEAISKTVDLLVEYGFNGSLLTSQNATIIIAYYLYKGGTNDVESKTGIRKYLIHALLKNIYSSPQDQLISKLRDGFRVEDKTTSGTYRKKYAKFSFEDLLSFELPGRQSFAVSESDINQFLEHKKGPASFFVLTLLYPGLRYAQVQFHQDHIHPAANFIDQKFQEMAIPPDQWQIWKNLRDCVPNLQLLEGRQNQSKNATPLKKWLQDGVKESERASFPTTNFFPEDVGLEFKDFIAFFEGRKSLLKTKLMEVLAISNTLPSVYIEPRLDDEDDEDVRAAPQSDDGMIE